MEAEAALSFRYLTTSFETPDGTVEPPSTTSVSTSCRAEVLGLCRGIGLGKSVTLRSNLRLVHPPGGSKESILWRGRDILKLPDRGLRQVRGSEIAMIFQEPMTALNPVLPIGIQIEESLQEHTGLDAAGRAKRGPAN